MTTLSSINLFNSFLNNNLNTNNDNTNNNTCLITNEPLTDNFITLSCGHKFNYLPIYKEVCIQKQKKILDNANLKLNQIKCPYCRTKINQILPYFNIYDNVNRIRGVNYPNIYCMNLYKCQFILKNNKKCDKNACKINNSFFCNEHIITNKLTNKIENNFETDYEIYFQKYKKLKITELKDLLRKNKCKLTGNKDELVDRIAYTISNKIIQNWIE